MSSGSSNPQQVPASSQSDIPSSNGNAQVVVPTSECTVSPPTAPPSVEPVPYQPLPLGQHSATLAQQTRQQPSGHSSGSRLPRPTRPGPYLNPGAKGKATAPTRPRPQSDDADSSKRKRTRNINPSGKGDTCQKFACAQALATTQATAPASGGGPSARQAATNAALEASTQQLARPEDTGALNHQQSDYYDEDGDPDAEMEEYAADDDTNEHEEAVEQLAASLDEDNDRFLSLVYDSDSPGGQGNKQLHRLVTQMLQKQDAMADALRDLRQSRDVSNNPPSQGNRPPRISPPNPRKPEDWDQSKYHSDPAGRQPRAARRILTSEIIRDTFAHLLKRKSNKDPLPCSPPDEIRYPTEENFGIRWSESDKSIFNRLAADVVLQHMNDNWRINIDPLTTEELEKIPMRISEHIRYLRRAWKKTQRDDAKELKRAELKAAAAASRRATRYESRLKVIDHFPQWLNMHRKLITQVGVAGISSDEEDPNCPGVFLIRRRPEFGSHFNMLKRYQHHYV